MSARRDLHKAALGLAAFVSLLAGAAKGNDWFIWLGLGLSIVLFWMLRKT
ncbi:MAG: LPXTG cell wall anchor domain-containing protein [Patescibacteria group bacterium]